MKFKPVLENFQGPFEVSESDKKL